MCCEPNRSKLYQRRGVERIFYPGIHLIPSCFVKSYDCFCEACIGIFSVASVYILFCFCLHYMYVLTNQYLWWYFCIYLSVCLCFYMSKLDRYHFWYQKVNSLHLFPIKKNSLHENKTNFAWYD